MTAKTYTKRENAKRAAIAAGVPAELVEITVHKDAEGVRFGWKAKDAAASAAQGAANTPAATATESKPVAAPAAAHVVTTSKPKQAAAPKVPRQERNGVKRPRAGGACAAVWDFCDHVARTEGASEVTSKVVKQAAADKGWNENNALIEMYGWRRFNGITGRVRATV